MIDDHDDPDFGQKEELESDLEAGLQAAFGAADPGGVSILDRIERLTGVKSQLLLHDSPDEESLLPHSLRDRDFAGVRDEPELEKLPPEEQQEWRAFWDEVRHAISR